MVIYKFKTGDQVTLGKHTTDDPATGLNWDSGMERYIGLTIVLDQKANTHNGCASWDVGIYSWREEGMTLYKSGIQVATPNVGVTESKIVPPVNDYRCMCGKWCSKTDNKCWWCEQKVCA